MTTVPPDAPSTLAYAPQQPRRWRRARQMLIRGLALCLLAILGTRFGPELFDAGQKFYWRRAAMSYQAPAGQVACDEPGRWGGVAPPFLAEAAEPPPLLRRDQWGRVRAQPRLRRLVQRSAEPGIEDAPVIFLHGRTTPGGVTRLVTIRRVPPPWRNSWDAPVAFWATLTVPQRLPWKEWPSISTELPEVIPQVFDEDATAVAVRVFAGRPDPADESHFTIEFTSGGTPGVIDGYLRDPKPGSDAWVELVLRP